MANQYRADQAYLGWLAVQPRSHRDSIGELLPEELASLGPNLRALDAALARYWSNAFPDDPIERVYFVYFFESPFDKPTPPPFHLHLHAIPRTRCIGAALRESEGTGTAINAWRIYRAVQEQKIPTPYLRPASGPWKEAEALLRYLRHELERGR